MAIWNRFFGGAASTAAGYGVGSALGPALNPITQAIANELWAKYPDVPLTPEQLAEAVVRGLIAYDTAAKEAAKSGTDDDANENAVNPFLTLYGLAGEPPGPQQVLELWNRDVLDEPQVNAALKQSRLRPEWVGPVKALRRVLVPVSDLIRMAVREVFDPEQRAALNLDAEYPTALTPEARKLGLAEDDARRYWAAHWNLPSREEGAQMLFRGELTAAQYDGLLKALDYAPTWRGKLRAISRAIPTLSDFIRFAVREVYSPDVRRRFGQDEDYPELFTQKAALHGLAEEDAKAYWAAHWELPSTEQGFRMLHRDLITDADLELLLRAKDVMPFWRGKVKQIAYLKPGRVDLRRMYAAGVINRARVKRGYLDLGYTDTDAETLTEFAVKLAEGSSTSTRLTATEQARNQLRARTHTSYLAAEIDEAEAREKLPQAGVPAGEVEAVLAVWNIEREVERKQLTPAQVKKAYAKATPNPATGLPWTKEDALAALIGRGYSTNDAQTFLAL